MVEFVHLDVVALAALSCGGGAGDEEAAALGPGPDDWAWWPCHHCGVPFGDVVYVVRTGGGLDVGGDNRGYGLCVVGLAFSGKTSRPTESEPNQRSW